MNRKANLCVAMVAVTFACALISAEVAAQAITVAPASPTISVGQTQPFTAAGVGTATAVDEGAFYSCALFQDGTARCWGENVSGQLGDGTRTNSSTPIAVDGISGAAAVTAGGYHTCARFPDGTLQCWGRNNAGQLGPAAVGESVTRPVPVPGITATAATAGGFHTCALPGDGTVRCWGQNDLGQLGNGTIDPTGGFNPNPVIVNGITTAVAISAGGWHTCALLQDGTVRCWGNNQYGELGNGTIIASPAAPTPTPSPVAVNGITTAVAIEAGIFHMCALLRDGTVQCWGRGEDGRLGNGSTANSSTPTTVPGISATALAAGAEHSCAILLDRTMRCWGDNNWGQLGNGLPPGTALTPSAPVTGIIAATGASSGAEHTCALLQDGTVRCWGNNNFGRLGVATTDTRTRPCPNSPSCAFDPVGVEGMGGVAWTSSDTTVATIDANGLATGRNPGSTTITATSGERSGSTILTVATRPTLSVVREGSGSGTVRSSDGRIVCGGTCSVDYESGSSVTLTAVAEPGSIFEGWRGGSCSGTGDCTVTLTANSTVFAGFSAPRPTFTLTVTVNNVGTGSGTVSSNDGGIDNCGTNCSASYDSGMTVTLTASPAPGSIFTGWSGCGTVSGATCTVTMSAGRSVTATFVRQRFTLTVTVNNVGTGSGTVSSNDGGINNCGTSCSASYDSGMTVTLTASPAPGSIFTGWSGCGTVSGATCTVTMSAARSVTATFVRQTFTLSVTREGSGTVTSISPDGRINCGGGGACSASYDSGTVVTLRATPDLLYFFVGWSGGGCSGTGDCVVTLGANTTVTARFRLLGLF